MRKLYKISDKIFFLKIEDWYDLCMTFFRVEEFYESSFPEFKGKDFQLLDYMEKYAKEFGNGVFCYPRDWDGFNIPSKDLKKCLFGDIKDLNKYDRFLLKILYKINQSIDNAYDNDFYLIGARSFEDSFAHEYAHALYYTNESYRYYVDKLILDIPVHLYQDLKKSLIDNSYPESVIEDEVQAYLSTGFHIFLRDKNYFSRLYYKYTLNKAARPFSELYNKYKLDSKNFEEIDLGQTFV